MIRLTTPDLKTEKESSPTSNRREPKAESMRSPSDRLGQRIGNFCGDGKGRKFVL
jgi:hypothetical protein